MKKLLCLISLFSILATPALADPILFAPEALQQSGRITLTPGFAPDGRTIYFAQSDCQPIWECPQRLKRSTFGPDGWSAPVLMPLPRGGGTQEPRVDYPSVTPDGSTLLFSWSGTEVERATYENFDLWSLDLTNPDATPERLQGPDLNRVRKGKVRTLRFVNNETAPNLTRAGDLYFWSERLDGPGERDIYVAEADGEGGFLRAKPLPSPINSAGRDAGSWVHPSGRLMLVTYPDRGGEGSDDIFVSVKARGTWTDPVNLGPSINGPASDFAAVISPDNEKVYFSSTRNAPDNAIQVWTVPVAEIAPLKTAMKEAGL